MNATNDYDVFIRDYCRMTLYLVEKALNISIPKDILQQDLGELLKPLFNTDKIRERPIINTEVNREENDGINQWEGHVIKMTQDWIKKPFQLDSILETIIFVHKVTHSKEEGKISPSLPL